MALGVRRTLSRRAATRHAATRHAATRHAATRRTVVRGTAPQRAATRNSAAKAPILTFTPAPSFRRLERRGQTSLRDDIRAARGLRGRLSRYGGRGAQHSGRSEVYNAWECRIEPFIVGTMPRRTSTFFYCI